MVAWDLSELHSLTTAAVRIHSHLASKYFSVGDA